MDVKSELIGPQPLTKKQKEAIKADIEKYEKRDRKIQKKREARNEYETAIYGARDWINDEDNAKYFKDQEEISTLLDQIDAEETWLDDEGYDESLDTYKDRKKKLDGIYKPFKRRKLSRNAVNKELKRLKTTIETTQKKFDKYAETRAWLPEADVE